MHGLELRRRSAVEMPDVKAPASGRLDMAWPHPPAPHPDCRSNSAIRANGLLEQRRVDAVLERYENGIFAQVGRERGERILCVIRAHGDKANVKFAPDLAGEDYGHGNIEGAIGHVNL